MPPDSAHSGELPWEIDVRTAARLMAEGAVMLIDCREPEEAELACIAGTVLVPLSQWDRRSGELEQYRDDHVVVHCHHGVRSLRVVRWMRERGFAKVQSMAGGIAAWSQRIDPSIPTY